MGTVDSGDLGLENRGGSLLDGSSSGIFMPLPFEKVLGVTVGSESIYNPRNGLASYFNGGWDPVVSLTQNVETVASSIASHDSMLENQGTCGISHLVRYQLDHSLAELMSNPSHLAGGSFSEMDSFLILHKCQQIGNSGRPTDYSLEGSGNEIALTSRSANDNCAQFREGCPSLHIGSLKPSPNGKKRNSRVLDDRSQFSQSKDMETEQQKDEFTRKQNEEEWTPKPKPVANLSSKLLAKELNGSSDSKEAPKEECVHVRAKRGQSTNRHSLAERLRRERISERMKFLQDLVPGCSKINGKALMLDEIINYVISLQRQVEFLSLKLATVYPEMDPDIGQILSRDASNNMIHHSQDGSAAILGDPGRTSYYPMQNKISGALPASQNSNLKLPAMPQASIWHEEPPSTSQMDYISNLVPDNLESRLNESRAIDY